MTDEDKNNQKQLIGNVIKGAAMLGAAVGAGIVASKVLDDDNKQKIKDAAHKVGDEVNSKAHDVASKVQGLVADAHSKLLAEFEEFKKELEENSKLDKNSEHYKEIQKHIHSFTNKIEEAKNEGEDKGHHLVEELTKEFHRIKDDYNRMK